MTVAECVFDLLRKFDFPDIMLLDVDTDIPISLDHCYYFDDYFYFDPTYHFDIKLNCFSERMLSKMEYVKVVNFPKKHIIFYKTRSRVYD